MPGHEAGTPPPAGPHRGAPSKLPSRTRPDASRVASTSPGFFEQVQDALEHLHDPTHLQTHPLARVAIAAQPTKPANAGKALRLALEEAMETLKPASALDPAHRSSHDSRGYDILHLRYLEALDLGSVLSTLSLSRSEFYRDQRRALEAVATVLRERWGVVEDEQPAGSPTGVSLGHLANEPRAATDRRRPESDLHTRATNLPLSLTSLVGREREIAEVTELLGRARLLTLTGAGGVGKTRLALEVARTVLKGYADGVWLVDLAPLADPDLLVSTVAGTLAIPDVPGQPRLNTILAALRARHVLLVLDNCEHIVNACAELARALLEACPRLTVLATSRERLAATGEITWLVPSLATPSLDVASSVDALLDYPAVRLFVERARAVEPSLELSADNADAVAMICRRLDGIPLAIELAAARMRVLAPAQIARRLDDRFSLLTGGARSGGPRQATLRAAVEWSHDLLAESERILFRRLSVFAGGWSLEAAEAVCASAPDSSSNSPSDPSGGIASTEVLDLLSRLVDKSLVLVEPTGGQVRYRYLETVRQYAFERLEQSGEVAMARRLHRHLYLEFAEEAELGVWQARQVEWLSILEREHDNLRAALRECLEADPEAGLRLASSIWRFWVDRGHYREAHAWLKSLLAAAPEDSPARGRALYALGILLLYHDGPRTARPALESGVVILRRDGDQRRLAHALVHIGSAALGGGDYARAREAIEEGLAVARGFPDEAWWGSTIGLAYLGDLEFAEGRADQAERLWAESLELSRQTGDSRCWGFALHKLGTAARARGELTRAKELLDESLALERRIGHLLGVHGLLREHSIWAQSRGSYLRSVRLLTAIGQMSWGLSPDDEALLARAHQALGEEAFARAWAAGQAMTPEEAVEYALGASPES